MGRRKSFDVRFEVKITLTQNAMLDVLSEWTGLTKSDIVREMLNSEVVHGFFREKLADTVGQAKAELDAGG